MTNFLNLLFVLINIMSKITTEATNRTVHEITHEKIINLLKSSKVDFEQLNHDHVHTSLDAASTRGNSLEQAAKALVLKEKKNGEFFMFIVGGNRKLDLKIIKKDVLKVKNISLAPPDEVFEKTGCKVGTVPPFGNLFNLKTYFDKNLLDTQEEIFFSAATHFDSVKMKTKDFVKVTNPIIESYSKEA